jgi:hypothetical protein
MFEGTEVRGHALFKWWQERNTAAKNQKHALRSNKSAGIPYLLAGMVAKDLAWRQASNLAVNIAIHSVNPSLNCHQHVLNAI